MHTVWLTRRAALSVGEAARLNRLLRFSRLVYDAGTLEVRPERRADKGPGKVSRVWLRLVAAEVDGPWHTADGSVWPWPEQVDAALAVAVGQVGEGAS